MVSRRKLFVDTDVVLDYLADRQPFAEAAHRLFGLSERGEVSVCICSLSYSNLYYLLRKSAGHSNAIRLLQRLKQITRISAVGEAEIVDALFASFTDSLKTASNIPLRNRKVISRPSSPEIKRTMKEVKSRSTHLTRC